jgi:ribonuclease T2
MKIYLFVLALLLPVAAGAQKKGKPGVFDYYLLTLSWSPEFCSTSPNDPQCTGNHHFGFVVHGMWPQFQNGTWPQNCSRRPGLSDPTAMLQIMPSKTLISHEWQKHGTCSGLSAQDYFGLTRRAFQGIRIPALLDAPATSADIGPSDLRAALRTANPALSDETFTIICRGKQLSEVRFCLDKDLKPVSCHAKDSCSRSDIIIPPVR